ncbi:MAG: hypothetical protein A2840_01065 [Candidatus Buchananbacteria bacterium RIFCSPHIGHO2_01_FULL_47_11b]|uniref:Uncharacterized protein n=1 Tax=Candidatus Buchananbacteria bacterium RIFCSPHIGHO2_01_FULL_47_11b TaxID=1797537 RepID=A0A1G1Y7L5_9BACT|nr:MAG: hypothetical protein A2840_01065 [Candidatus Buchananbacteria bacterium RIFCSPHIGHO2_01_FULL_47_11b]
MIRHKKGQTSAFFILAVIVIIALGFGLRALRTQDSDGGKSEQLQAQDYYNQGRSNETIDKMVARINELKTSLEADPSDYEALNELGIIYQLLGETQLALQTFELAATEWPDEGLVRANMAELYLYEFKDIQRAEELYREAIEKGPPRTDWYRALADLWISEFPEKIGEVESLMLEGTERIEFRKREFYTYLIDFFWSQKDFDKAIEYTKKAIQESPDDDLLQDTLRQLEELRKNS